MTGISKGPHETDDMIDETYTQFLARAARSPLYVLDEDGSVVACDDFEEWVQWFEQADRYIEEDRVGTVTISTAFLGFDHQPPLPVSQDIAAPPVLWSTTIFGGIFDCLEARYDSLRAAREGHALALRAVRTLQWIPARAQRLRLFYPLLRLISRARALSIHTNGE